MKIRFAPSPKGGEFSDVHPLGSGQKTSENGVFRSPFTEFVE